MKACDEFIQRIADSLPPLCTVNDLIRVGIFHSPQSAAHARGKGDTPSYFVLGVRRIVYPKESVIEWLEERKHDTCQVQGMDNAVTSPKKIPKSAPIKAKVVCNCRPADFF